MAFFCWILESNAERGLRVKIFEEIRSKLGADHERHFIFFQQARLVKEVVSGKIYFG